jgi:hypothetical protein
MEVKKSKPSKTCSSVFTTKTVSNCWSMCESSVRRTKFESRHRATEQFLVLVKTGVQLDASLSMLGSARLMESTVMSGRSVRRLLNLRKHACADLEVASQILLQRDALCIPGSPGRLPSRRVSLSAISLQWLNFTPRPNVEFAIGHFTPKFTTNGDDASISLIRTKNGARDRIDEAKATFSQEIATTVDYQLQPCFQTSGMPLHPIYDRQCG